MAKFHQYSYSIKSFPKLHNYTASLKNDSQPKISYMILLNKEFHKIALKHL